MAVKRIFAFGDSFTQGEGANLKLCREIEAIFVKERSKSKRAHGLALVSDINRKLSWTQHVEDDLGIYVDNQAETGASNQKIFQKVFDVDKWAKFNSDDLIIVAWSSILRDPMPFLPNVYQESSPTGIGWSIKELAGKDAERLFLETYPDKLDKSEKNYLIETLVPFMKEFFKDYIVDIHDGSLHNYLTVNYIYFLQKFFESRGIRYMMVDAFENTTAYKSCNPKLWKSIDTEYYMGFDKTTLWDLLNDKCGEKDVWEDEELRSKTDGIKHHPNMEGYKIISEFVLEYLKETFFKKTAI